jgi:tRNA dimethylallyltransferase
MGPTASGKSALAMKLSEHFPVEIVSVDSAQIYRDMDVGTAKPSHEDRSRIAHHLIDILAPTERYSAAQFVRDANRLIAEIRERGNLPLLVGGTMLYFKALTQGLNDLPVANAAVRAGIDARAAIHGWPRLHEELAAIDPVTAARLRPTDRQRIQRALEVFQISGRPLSALLNEPVRGAATTGFLRIALAPSTRTALHVRIARRFDAMLEAGLVDEVRSLRERYALTPGLPAMRAVGYRQAWNHIEGLIDLPTLRDQAIFATRQLAKRQLTCLRVTEAEVFDCLSADVESNALEWLARRLPR